MHPSPRATLALPRENANSIAPPWPRWGSTRCPATRRRTRIRRPGRSWRGEFPLQQHQPTGAGVSEFDVRQCRFAAPSSRRANAMHSPRRRGRPRAEGWPVGEGIQRPRLLPRQGGDWRQMSNKAWSSRRVSGGIATRPTASTATAPPAPGCPIWAAERRSLIIWWKWLAYNNSHGHHRTEQRIGS